MSLDARVRRLEQQRGADEPECPGVDAYLVEAHALRRWLSDHRLTAAQALALGMGEPAELGLRFATIAGLVAGRSAAVALRRQLAPGEPLPAWLAGAETS